MSVCSCMALPVVIVDWESHAPANVTSSFA